MAKRASARFGAVAACLAAATALAACTSSGGNGGGGGGGGGSNQVHGTVTVFAATSLTAAFNRIGMMFERAHPGTDVRFNYNGSSTLASNIRQGARADVFASADESNMNTVTHAGDAEGDPTIFARNKMEIMVPRGNPMHVTSVRDLAADGKNVVVCAPAVPCGMYARQVFRQAGVNVTPVSEETNVGGVVSKVTTGEADAGMVYETDVKANENDASGVTIPDNQNITAKYPMVEVRNAHNSAAARAFISYVESDAGQRVLTDYGFQRAH